MTRLKSILRQWIPYGLIERRRRNFRLRRLGLSAPATESRAYDAAVSDCHFDLWPACLRHSQDWTLVDVGANKGDFIRAALRLAQPASVIAFEPLPSCHAHLSQLIAGVAGAQLVRAAAGAAPATLKLNCTGNSKMSSLLVPCKEIEESYQTNDFAIQEKIEVPVVRLDDVVADHVHVGLLKLDVQGYEMEALRGGTRMLDKTKALLTEVNFVAHYEGATAFDELHAFLKDFGFHLYGMSAPYVDRGRPLWADAMYVRGDPETW